MRNTLNNFNKLCRILNEENMTAEFSVNGGQPVKMTQTQDGFEGSSEITVQQNQNDFDTEQNSEEFAYAAQMQQFIEELYDKLEIASETARTARQYQIHATNKEQVLYDKGFAQGQKSIIKYVIKKLNSLMEM